MPNGPAGKSSHVQVKPPNAEVRIDHRFVPIALRCGAALHPDGRGPEHLVDSGIGEHLRTRGHEVHVHTLESMIDAPSEVTLAVDLARVLAEQVGASKRNGHFPLILAGRCMAALGAVAGLESNRTGVVWFDSHGDFNTPETSRSGMLDGMAGAVIAGRCWRGVSTTVPGFVPVSESRYVLIGARDLDPPEAELLRDSAVTLVSPQRIGTEGPAVAPDSLASDVWPLSTFTWTWMFSIQSAWDVRTSMRHRPAWRSMTSRESCKRPRRGSALVPLRCRPMIRRSTSMVAC